MDHAIADTAVGQLRIDLNNGLDHLIMARTSNKQRAEQIFTIYQNIVPNFNPIVVHSDYPKTEIKKRLNKLLSRQSRIVICVDMLGEGYDLPNLKIAALHDHHKSLAVTLQFIGRFTRVNKAQKIGQASVVMNVADPNVEGELQHLYSTDADWDNVLRRLSEGRIAREIRLQEVVDALKGKVIYTIRFLSGILSQVVLSCYLKRTVTIGSLKDTRRNCLDSMNPGMQ